MTKFKSYTILFLTMFVLGIALAALTPLETEASPGPPCPNYSDCAVFPQCSAWEGSLGSITVTMCDLPDTTFLYCGCR